MMPPKLQAPNLTNPQINLLPESVRAKKQGRRHLFILAALQIVILLCMALIIRGVGNLEYRAQETSARLAHDIDEMRRNPDLATIETTIMLLHQQAAADAFFEENAPSDFDIVWLSAVLYAMSGQVTALIFDGTGVRLTGVAYCFTEMEALRQAIEATGVFGYVGLGGIRSGGGEGIQYELVLVE